MKLYCLVSHCLTISCLSLPVIDCLSLSLFMYRRVQERAGRSQDSDSRAEEGGAQGDRRRREGAFSLKTHFYSRPGGGGRRTLARLKASSARPGAYWAAGASVRANRAAARKAARPPARQRGQQGGGFQGACRPARARADQGLGVPTRAGRSGAVSGIGRPSLNSDPFLGPNSVH